MQNNQCIVTLDPHKLGIRCRLNGEVVQNSNTDQLVHKTEDLVVFISKSVLKHTLTIMLVPVADVALQVCDPGTR